MKSLRSILRKVSENREQVVMTFISVFCGIAAVVAIYGIVLGHYYHIVTFVNASFLSLITFVNRK